MTGCPMCGATAFEYCAGHKIKVKGGFDPDFVQDICFKCGYESKPYSERISFDRPFVVSPPPRSARHSEPTKEEKILFTACKGDMEISIKVGKEGFSKLLSMFMDGA